MSAGRTERKAYSIALLAASHELNCNMHYVKKHNVINLSDRIRDSLARENV